MRKITLCFFLVSPVSYATVAAIPNDAAATVAPVKKRFIALYRGTLL
ncbi:TPA: hypothetical protein R4173_003426 [Serratia marcescens]|nr:hypothetical protein [Serratia marcescens]HED2342005.1 hypothetical protein [Serratia marcescens]HED3702046.1 hypothetical protein [Serratia marcescens]HED3727879.1 hypothetical protein [Serratia marcescens]HED3748830.1 hypothetical protein [Serratia marcescens]